MFTNTLAEYIKKQLMAKAAGVDSGRTIPGSIASQMSTAADRAMESAAAAVADEARSRGVLTLVLGLPKNMDGSEGERARLSRDFAELLTEKHGLAVTLWDERRSSIEAHAILHANGRKMKQHKKNVDAVAASLILEGYLDSLK